MPSGRLVHPVEAAAHPRRAQREAELALHRARLVPRRLLLVVEARQRVHARPLALLLVLAGEEALVAPGVVEGAQEVLERRVVAGGPAAQVELDRVVQRAAVDDGVMLPQRDAQDVDVLVLERARLVVVHLPVADRERLGVRGQGRRVRGRRRPAAGAWRCSSSSAWPGTGRAASLGRSSASSTNWLTFHFRRPPMSSALVR